MGSGNTDNINHHNDLSTPPQPDSYWDSLTTEEISSIRPSTSDFRTLLRGVLSQLKRLQHGDDAGSWKDDITAARGSAVVYRDLSAQVDGVATTFTLPEAARPGTLGVFWDGLLQNFQPGFSLNAPTPTTFTSFAPPPGTVLVVSYMPA